MKKFTKVCLIICAVLGVIGLSSLLAGGILGAGWNSLGNIWSGGSILERFWHWDDYDDHHDWEEEVKESIEDAREAVQEELSAGEEAAAAIPYSTDEVQDLEVEVRKAVLTVLPSSDSDIHVESYNEKNKILLKDGRLKITYNGRANDNQIYLYLPEGFTFREADIDVAAGTADIENLSADELDLEVGAGVLTVNGTLTAGEMKCAVGAGSATIALLDAQKVELECGMGEMILTLQGSEADYRGKLECGIGALTYGDSDYSGPASTQELSGTGNRQLEAECEMGSLEIDFGETM